MGFHSPHFTSKHPSKRFHPRKVNMNTFTIVQIALFGAVAVSGQTRDICGDPVPTKEWYSNPLKVVEHMKDLETTKEITTKIENHPYIEMVEKGQLTRDKMQDFIVQQIYGNEYDARTYGGGYNMFGFAYPKQDSREYFAKGLNATLYELDTLRTIGTKFGLDDIDKLIKHEPNPSSLMWSTVLAESVMHAQHHSEVVVAVVTLASNYKNCMQRIKKALETNTAYKSWNLDAKRPQLLRRRVR